MPPLWTGEASAEGYIMTHPIKAAGTVALCWVFSIVQRKDRLSGRTAGLFAGWHRQAAGEAGTKCCPHERGHYGHCTGWKRTSGIREQTSYFICTYRSSFQGGCGLFYSTHFYFIPRHITKEYMIFITGVPAIVRVRFFCALMHPPYRGRGPPLRS